MSVFVCVYMCERKREERRERGERGDWEEGEREEGEREQKIVKRVRSKTGI